MSQLRLLAATLFGLLAALTAIQLLARNGNATLSFAAVLLTCMAASVGASRGDWGGAHPRAWVYLSAMLGRSAWACVRFQREYASGGVGDLRYYHESAQTLATETSGLIPYSQVTALTRFGGPTGNVSYGLATLYKLVEADPRSAAAAFTSASFVGLVLMSKALGLARGQRRTVEQFLLVGALMPSWGFWTAFGKDAISQLTIGAALVLAVRLGCRGERLRPIETTWLVGLLGVGVAVRPHIAFAIITSLFVASVLGTRPDKGKQTILRILAAPAASIVALVAFQALLARLGIQSAVDALEGQAERTAIGNTSFGAGGSYLSPQGAFRAASSVLFRPFPWSAGSDPLLLVSSGEGLLLGAGLILRWTQRDSPSQDGHSRLTWFLILCCFSTTILVGNVSNLGILVRIRMQVWAVLIWYVFRAASPFAERDGPLPRRSPGTTSHHSNGRQLAK